MTRQWKMLAGNMIPIPKHTHHIVDGLPRQAALRTIRKMAEASDPPEVSGKFVTRMRIDPLLLSVYALADSDADVLDAGYSPPVPNPVIPRATVNIQNIPAIVVPLAPADRASPRIIIPDVRTMATFRPR